MFYPIGRCIALAIGSISPTERQLQHRSAGAESLPSFPAPGALCSGACSYARFSGSPCKVVRERCDACSASTQSNLSQTTGSKTLILKRYVPKRYVGRRCGQTTRAFESCGVSAIHLPTNAGVSVIHLQTNAGVRWNKWYGQTPGCYSHAHPATNAVCAMHSVAQFG